MSDFDRLLGDSLKEIRDEHVRQIEPEVFPARQRIDQKLRSRRVRFVVGGTAVAAAALAAFLFVSQTIPKLDRATPIRPSGEPVIVNRIDVPGVADIEPGLGALWVAHPKGLVGIDPLSGRITTESPVRPVDHMSLNDEAMYAIDTSDRGISRIPFGTDEAAFATRMEGTPTLVAASDNAVWVAAAVGPVGYSQITAYTPHLEVPGDTAVVLNERVVADMTHADGALWMSVSEPPPGFGPLSEPVELRRYWDDGGESTWELSESVGRATDIAVGEGAAWVLRPARGDGGDTITRVDLETNKVTESAVSFDDTIESIAVGEGYLWVTTAPTAAGASNDAVASLHRVDPTTLETVGEPLEVGGPGSQIEVGSGFVWVADPHTNQIVQIDPSRNDAPAPTPTPTPTPSPEPTPSATRGPEQDEKADVDPDEAFAMWPETTPEEAAVSCSRAVRQPNSSRRQPESVAVTFADEVLGWEDVVVGVLEDEAPRDTYRSVTIEQETATRTVPRYAPLINVTLREVAADCWSVSSLRTDNYRVPEDAPTGISVSSVDGVVEVVFDLDREAAGNAVANVRLLAGSEETVVPAARFREKSTIALRQEPSGRPGYYLVLLEGPDGEVVGALGGALPSDDFVAG